MRVLLVRSGVKSLGVIVSATYGRTHCGENFNHSNFAASLSDSFCFLIIFQLPAESNFSVKTKWATQG
jgi:hypothetical protein